MKIGRVLCPCDFSDSSRRALAHAVELARWWTATVDVLHVHPPPVSSVPVAPMAPVPGGPIPSPALTPPPAPALPPTEALRSAGEDLRRFVASVGETGPGVVTTLREGAPVGTILEHAESVGTDLIVMGTRGRSGLERLVLGSTAEKVLATASCPVLTVRVQGSGRAVPRRVLCAVDFSEASGEALRWATTLSAKAGALLQVLHVVRLEPGPLPPAVEGEAEDIELARKDLEEFLEGAWTAGDCGETALSLERTVTPGTPPREIVSAAEEGSADLIVMGVQGHGALDRMLFGSTTHHVVREAPCPVLSVRPSGR